MKNPFSGFFGRGRSSSGFGGALGAPSPAAPAVQAPSQPAAALATPSAVPATGPAVLSTPVATPAAQPTPPPAALQGSRWVGWFTVIGTILVVVAGLYNIAVGLSLAIPFLLVRLNLGVAKMEERTIGGSLVFVERKFGGWHFVPPKHTLLVLRFGKAYGEPRREGWVHLWPWEEAIIQPSGQDIELDISMQGVLTRDTQSVNVDGWLAFVIEDPVKAALQIPDLMKGLRVVARAALISAVGEIPMEGLQPGLADIASRVRAHLAATAADWGVEITRCVVEGIEIHPDLVDAIARAEAAIREAEAAKRVAEMAADAEARNLGVLAEAKREAAIKEAEGAAAALREMSAAEIETALAEMEAQGPVYQWLQEAQIREKMAAHGAFQTYVDFSGLSTLASQVAAYLTSCGGQLPAVRKEEENGPTT